MIIFIRQSLLAVPMCLILTSPVFHLGTVQPRYRTISAVTPGKAASWWMKSEETWWLWWYALPEPTVAPANAPSQKESSFLNHHFSDASCWFQGGQICLNFPTSWEPSSKSRVSHFSDSATKIFWWLRWSCILLARCDPPQEISNSNWEHLISSRKRVNNCKWLS